ncbi:MAG: orotidine-5'-phosphate decarboxylase [Clostridiales bacterium]|nr:orotidine-5'-phosphate decarboxylase [Clostridiales bacterium]
MAIDELIYRIKYLRNPSVVGLDPDLDFLPDCVWDSDASDLTSASQAILRFNCEIIDAVYDIVPAVKPQIAMYERFGANGVNAYADTISYAKAKGLLIIADIKRGDIASTADAYADAHLGRVNIKGMRTPVFDVDFVTVNPYLGEDAVAPFIKSCRKYNKGVFVLVKTSNPGSGQIQDLQVLNQKVSDFKDSGSKESDLTKSISLYEHVAALVSEWGRDLIGESGYSAVGAVVGATHPKQARRLREIMPHTFFLAPGYGAQGAKAADLVKGSIVNSSRGIIAAYKNPKYKDKFGPEQFAKAARAAVLEMREDLRCLEI